MIFLAAKLAAAQGISTRPGNDVIASVEPGKPSTTTVQVANGDTPKDSAIKDEDDKVKKHQEETRKKKEEEEKKEVKSQDKSRPVSSTPVPGTPW